MKTRQVNINNVKIEDWLVEHRGAGARVGQIVHIYVESSGCFLICKGAESVWGTFVRYGTTVTLQVGKERHDPNRLQDRRR